MADGGSGGSREVQNSPSCPACMVGGASRTRPLRRRPALRIPTPGETPGQRSGARRSSHFSHFYKQPVGDRISNSISQDSANLRDGVHAKRLTFVPAPTIRRCAVSHPFSRIGNCFGNFNPQKCRSSELRGDTPTGGLFYRWGETGGSGVARGNVSWLPEIVMVPGHQFFSFAGTHRPS